MIPKEVIKAFDVLCSPDKPLVWIATSCDEKPHLVPVCFVKSLGEEQILIGDVFIKQTVRNIEKNPNVAVGVAFNRKGWDGYLLKGTAAILKRGEVFESFKKEIHERSGGKREISSAILINIKDVFSLAPKKGSKKLL